MKPFTILLGLVLSICLYAQNAPTYPEWWFEEGVVGENPPPAPGELGHDQGTWDAWIADNQPPPGPSDPAYDAQNSAHVAAWQAWSEENYAPANLGQLKNIATAAQTYINTKIAPFVIDWDSAYAPYTNPFPLQPSVDDHAPANIGQVKFIADGLYVILEFYQFPIADDINGRLPAGSPSWTENRPWT